MLANSAPVVSAAHLEPAHGAEAQDAAEGRGLGLRAVVVPAAAALFFFFLFFLAKCLPSWPPSPEIRTAHAKFTDFIRLFFRISA